MEKNDYTRFANVKKITYPNGCVELRIYDKPIKVNYDIDKKSSQPKYEYLDGVQFDVFSGEIRSENSIKHSLASSHSRSINKIYELANSNIWEWFFTFTFSKEKVDRYNYDECYKKLSKFLNNYKSKKCKDLIYLVVPELHKDGAVHFHGLFSGVNPCDMVLSKVKDIYNFTPYKLGFSTATKVTDTYRVATYITKYVTKDILCIDGRHRYMCSKGLVRPTIEYELIPNNEVLPFKVELIGKSNYVKEVKVPSISQQITYCHIDGDKLK